MVSSNVPDDWTLRLQRERFRQAQLPVMPRVYLERCLQRRIAEQRTDARACRPHPAVCFFPLAKVRQRTDPARASAHAAAIMKSPSPQSLVCPHCHAPVKRVPRRLTDRLVSLFAPVWRFSCPAPRCGWQGLVRRDAPGAAHHVRGRAYGGRKALVSSRGSGAAGSGPAR